MMESIVPTTSELSELLSSKLVLTTKADDEPPETAILPDEIWVKIFRELPLEFLNTVRMVSKHFYALSQDRSSIGRKPSKNVSISGPAGSGKTSLIGRLLYSVGNYAALGLKAHALPEGIENQVGKLAALLDADRRSHVDVTRFEIDRNEYDLRIISTPGKQKYIRNAISGIVQADYNVLVLEADMAELRPHDQRLNQVADQMKMLKAMGMKQLIILVNKMDSPAFGNVPDQKELEQKMSRAFHQLQLWIEDTAKRSLWGRIKPIVIPVSVLTGANITHRGGLGDWANYFPSLMELLDSIRVPNREFHRPLRLIVDRTHSIKGVGTVFVGTILQGIVRQGQMVLVGPCDDELHPVRSLQLALTKTPTKVGVAGDYIAMAIPAVAPLAAGAAPAAMAPQNPHARAKRRHGRIAGLPRDIDVYLSLAERRRNATLLTMKTAAERAYEELERRRNGALYSCAQFTATIVVFAIPSKREWLNVSKAEFVMHVHNAQVPVRMIQVEKILTTSPKRAPESLVQNIQTLFAGEIARVRFAPSSSATLSIDIPQNCSRLGRIVLRIGHELLAAGVVQETYYYASSQYFKKADKTALMLGAQATVESS